MPPRRVDERRLWQPVKSSGGGGNNDSALLVLRPGVQAPPPPNSCTWATVITSLLPCRSAGHTVCTCSELLTSDPPPPTSCQPAIRLTPPTPPWPRVLVSMPPLPLHLPHSVPKFSVLAAVPLYHTVEMCCPEAHFCIFFHPTPPTPPPPAHPPPWLPSSVYGFCDIYIVAARLRGSEGYVNDSHSSPTSFTPLSAPLSFAGCVLLTSARACTWGTSARTHKRHTDTHADTRARTRYEAEAGSVRCCDCLPPGFKSSPYSPRGLLCCCRC